MIHQASDLGRHADQPWHTSNHASALATRKQARAEDVGPPDMMACLRRADGRPDGDEGADVELDGPDGLHAGRQPVDLAGQEHEDLPAGGTRPLRSGVDRLAVLQETRRGEEQRPDEKRHRVGLAAHGVHVPGHRAQREKERADGEQHPHPPVAIARRPPRRAAWVAPDRCLRCARDSQRAITPSGRLRTTKVTNGPNPRSCVVSASVDIKSLLSSGLRFRYRYPGSGRRITRPPEDGPREDGRHHPTRMRSPHGLPRIGRFSPRTRDENGNVRRSRRGGRIVANL